jgi:hypothetical protein
MMLLLGTGSIVGISSIYTPANVETQPQQQPQPQPLPQPQKPQTTIPGLKIPQSKIELGQQIADQNALRAIQDKQLLDRLMPQIIKRIDVKLVLTERPSKTVIVDHEGLYRDPITTKLHALQGKPLSLQNICLPLEMCGLYKEVNMETQANGLSSLGLTVMAESEYPQCV